MRRALCRRHTLPTIAPRAFCSPSPSKLARAVATHVSRCIADSTAAKLSLCHAQGPSSHSFHLSLSLYIGTCSLLVKKKKKDIYHTYANRIVHVWVFNVCLFSHCFIQYTRRNNSRVRVYLISTPISYQHKYYTEFMVGVRAQSDSGLGMRMEFLCPEYVPGKRARRTRPEYVPGICARKTCPDTKFGCESLQSLQASHKLYIYCLSLL